MAWVRLDDEFDEHPKIARLGPFGAWLQIQALCYCNRNLTDGFLPAATARGLVAKLAAWEDDAGRIWKPSLTCGMQGLDADEFDWVALLVQARVWVVVPGGYQLHDFDQYQPTKAEVFAERERSRTRQAKRRHGGSHGVTPAESRRNSVGPVPGSGSGSGEDQISLPSVTQGDAPSPRPTELGFDAFWKPYPKKRHKPAAAKAWQAIDGARHLEPILAGVERWKGSDAWSRGFVEDPATFLRQRQWEDDPRRASTLRAPGRVQPTVEDTRELLKHL